MRIALGRDAAGNAIAVLDPAARMPGRGAYLCRQAGGAGPSKECAALARRRRGLARTLRAAVTLNDEIVESVN